MLLLVSGAFCSGLAQQLRGTPQLLEFEGGTKNKGEAQGMPEDEALGDAVSTDPVVDEAALPVQDSLPPIEAKPAQVRLTPSEMKPAREPLPPSEVKPDQEPLPPSETKSTQESLPPDQTNPAKDSIIPIEPTPTQEAEIVQAGAMPNGDKADEAIPGAESIPKQELGSLPREEEGASSLPAVAQEAGGGPGVLDGVGIPYSTIFRGSGGPIGSHLFHGGRDPLDLNLPAPASRNGTVGEEVKIGEGSARFRVKLPGFGTQYPSPYVPFLHRGFAPQNAHLKLGSIYVHFGQLTGEFLASDNVNLTQYNREAGCISVIRLGMTVVAQLTEGWQFGVAGTISYLPFQQKVGVGIFTGLDAGLGSFLLGLNAEPLLTSQLSYSTLIGGWQMVFADDFEISRGYYSNGTRDDFYRFDAGVNTSTGEYEDRAGRYSFSAPRTKFDGSTSEVRGELNDFNDIYNFDLTYLSNVVSVTTSRLLPSELLVKARAYREDLWYYNDGDRGLPTWRDVATFEATSKRNNLRFKPFVGYEVTKTSQMESGVDQEFYAGMRGPITDQVDIYTKISLLRDFQGDESLLWNLRFDHVAGPYTIESLSYIRAMSDFHDEIDQYVEYRLTQILGPDLYATVYARYGRIETRFDPQSAGNDTRIGLLLTYNVSPKTQMRLGATYAQNDNNTQRLPSETWTVRYDINQHISDTLTARLLYQYQRSKSEQYDSDYYENLIYLTLTKTFR